MKFTMFTSVFDTEKVDSDRPWPAIVERAQHPREYPRKDAMPLFKCAIFGDERSTRGMLRHERNMRAITGLEGEHDAGTVAPEDVVTSLGMKNITALVYTTPSHTPDAPRWRIFAPLSREYPVDDRAHFVARLNGVVDGALADESFVPAQTYYWGRVAGAPYWASQSLGEFVDLLPALDASARAPTAHRATATATAAPSTDAIMEGGRNRALFAVACGLRRRNLSPDAILAALLAENAVRCTPPLPDAEVHTIARSAAQYTPAMDYVPVPAGEPVVVGRVEIVRTGILIPRSVVAAQEVRIESLRDVLGERNGAYPNSLANAAAIVAVALNGRLWLDESTRLPMLGARPLTEVDAFKITAMAGDFSGGQNFRDNTFYKAMVMLANENPNDPWCDWLNSLVWDGTERLNAMAEDYFGVTVGEDELERIILRKLMIGVVARQFEPGAKFDAMLVLEGGQGTGKSRSLRALFGTPYVASWEHDFNSKDFRQQLQGNVCIEVAELASFQRSEMNAIKSIVSEPVDVFRPSYGRHVERRPRRCVIVGTSNEYRYLTDLTGNRRFWPLRCGHINVEGIEQNRDQLFAEAVAAYRFAVASGVGARLWEVPDRITAEQAGRMVEEPWADKIKDYLTDGAGRDLRDVTTTLLLEKACVVPTDRLSIGGARKVAGILRGLGWIEYKSGTIKWRRP